MLKDQIKEITSSKLNIFLVSISLLPKLTGWTEFFIKFGENIKYVFVILIIMFFLLAIHVYMKYAGRKQKKDSDNSVNEYKLSLNDNSYHINFGRILRSFILLMFVFSISFIYFLKDAPVYYVKVSGNLDAKEAITKRDELSVKFFKHNKNEFIPTIRRRSAKNQNKNYFLSINGAFLDKEKAKNQFQEIKKLLGNKSSILLYESKNAHITRKIEYLIANFIPYRILILF